MTAPIEIRFESKADYEIVQKSSFAPSEHKSITGYLSLRKPNSPLGTVELDEDSFGLAYSGWTAFVEQALSAYAVQRPNSTATVYTYSTGSSPSFNSSRGENHQKLGWHNAVFFGVVGKSEILETITFALAGGVGVPIEVIQASVVDVEKRSQIQCAHSPDSIDFKRMGKPSYQVEDGKVWCPYEQNTWYTHEDWQQVE